MTDYSSIKGNRIQYLDSDPTLDSNSEGQVWYNNATGALKGLVQIKAWSSGGNMNTARSGGSGSGSQTAALSFGGTDTPGARTTATESYSGYVWTTSPNSMNTARANLGAAGTQTATLAFGGVIGAPTFASQSATESWNGTSWTTSPATINTARYSLAGFGTQTAAVAAGGTTGTETELYDGTSWTSNPTGLNTSRRAMGSAGTQTAGLVFGGGDGPAASAKTATESWNGSTWTSVNSMGTARYSLAGFGTQTSAVAALGNLVPGTITAATEEYDGTSWITTISASTARGAIPGSAGTSKAGLVFGGYATVRTTTTEEYNSAITQLGAGVWASGGNLNTARGSFNTSYGTQTAALATGGERTPGGTQETAVESYNGTSWTTGTALPTATNAMGGGGPQTAAIMMGGNTPDDVRTAAALDYDGSTWTSAGTMPQVSGATRGFGTQTAALCVGGQQNPGNTYHATTMEYDGASWSNGGAYPVNNTPSQGVINLMGFGTQTSGLCAGGSHGNGFGSNNRLNTNSYNGSTWSAENNLQSLALFGGAFGTQGGGIISGYAPPPVGLTTTQRWDGNGWTTTTSNSVGSQGKAGGGDVGSGIIIGGVFAPSSGQPWGEIANTEEWTGESIIAATASTLTTS